MATTSGPTEEIIEKKASAPVATACLIIACVALIGAIAFEIAEIAGYRSGGINAASETPGQDKAKAYVKKLKADVEALLTQNAPGATAAGVEGSMDADTATPGADDAADKPAADEEPAADEPAADAEPAADEPAADAEPAADEPAADEPAADEPAADEPAADEPAADDSST